MFSFSTTAKIGVVIASSAVALAVAGCSSAPTNTSSTPTTASSLATPVPSATRSDFNDADVTFLQMMYPHHAQAIDMAKLVPGRSQNAQLLALAGNIEKAQGPEMSQMTALLASFGKPAPTTADDHMGMDMPGMMSGSQMSTLTNLSGPAFDRMWLQMMIDHHSGAIEMSHTELRDGVNVDAKKVAGAVIANQQAEIGQMRAMLE